MTTTKALEAEVARYADLPYSLEIRPDDCGDERCYLAVHPELYGCMAQGSTPAEALENLNIARADYIAALLAAGIPVPLPRQPAPVSSTPGAIRSA